MFLKLTMPLLAEVVRLLRPKPAFLGFHACVARLTASFGLLALLSTDGASI